MKKFLKIITLVCICIFSFSCAYAGSTSNPDATVTYTQNDLKWTVPADNNGTAQLNIFSDANGRIMLSPTSRGNYYLKINNNAPNGVTYHVYLYKEPSAVIQVPIDYKINGENRVATLDNTNTPVSLTGKEILCMNKGIIHKGSSQVLDIYWYWKTVSDEQDTYLGTTANASEIIYALKVMVSIDDGEEEIEEWNNGKPSKKKVVAYICGYPDKTFKPDNNITRAEVGSILYKLYKSKATESAQNMKYSDVKKEEWYYEFVKYLSDANIFKGYPDGTFRPNNNITRAEFIELCVRFYEKSNNKVLIKSKDNLIDVQSHWAEDNIRKAFRMKWVIGYEDGTIRPDQSITRAEVVAIMNRILERVPDKNYIDANKGKMNTYKDLEIGNKHWAYYEIMEASN